MDVDHFQGIPDQYDGRVLIKRHTQTGSLPGFTGGNDVYICNFPTPGVAYWWSQRTAGSTTAMVFSPVYYSDFNTLFPSGSECSVVNNFRYASNVIEIVPTVNQFLWTGAIEVWKSSTLVTPGNLAGELILTGFDAINSTKPSSVFPFNHGMYACTRNTDPVYSFHPVCDNQSIGNVYGATNGVSHTFAGGDNFTGFGTQEWVVVKIPACPTSNTGLLRTWACVEYQVNSSSVFYDFATASCGYDPRALQLLNEFFKSHPCAVPYYDNESFWKEFWKWANLVSGALKVVPGPVGEVANIANLVGRLAIGYA
jgi:hypothetical protein